MNRNKINDLIEYLCPTFILSYFLFHNIYIVLIGITLSLYLLNSDFINRIIREFNTKLVSKIASRDLIKKNKGNVTNSNNIKSIKDESILKLVEEIEELGVIPKLDKNDDSKVA